MSQPNAPRKVINIPAHGGTLVNRLANEAVKKEWLAKVPRLPRVNVLRRERCDLEMLAIGAYSPLTGFMGRKDYEGVVGGMKLAGGRLWSIPITLGVSQGKRP